MKRSSIRLPGFVESGLDPAKINLAIGLSRKLWIHAPDQVVIAFDKFFKSIETSQGHASSQLALGELVLEMRKDASILATLIPRFRTKLKASEFQLKSAKVIPSMHQSFQTKPTTSPPA